MTANSIRHSISVFGIDALNVSGTDFGDTLIRPVVVTSTTIRKKVKERDFKRIGFVSNQQRTMTDNVTIHFYEKRSIAAGMVENRRPLIIVERIMGIRPHKMQINPTAEQV
jgi:hypothetical protein